MREARTTVRWMALVAAVLLALIGGVFLGAYHRYPLCINEDGSGGPTPCVWDAQVEGNGVGHSFIVRPKGTTVYFDEGDITNQGHGVYLVDIPGEGTYTVGGN